MLHLLTTTSELKSDNDFEPRKLSDGNVDAALLTRHNTSVSELSRILTALRDDHEQDVAEFELYRSRPAPEEALIQQLELVSPEAEGDELVLDEKDQEDHPIDGPYAFWQAVLVMLVVFSTWGANAAFGVFLNYYLTSDLFPGATKYDFALMGGLVVFLAQFLAPLTALLVKIFGQFPVQLTGIIIQTIGYFLASACTKLWQLILCQGVLVGLSFALIFIPGTLVLPTWFDKQRATAMGIAVAGAGLGGLVFSLSLNKIIQETGDHKWALRAVGFITLATSLFGSLLMRVRAPKKSKFRDRLNMDFFIKNFKIVFDIRVFDNYPMILLGIWFGVVLFGYVIILYSFSSFATSIGLSHTQGSNILAILNAAQVVGRPVIGNIGDFTGRANAAAAICLFIAVLVFGYWLNTTTYPALIGLSVVLGAPVGVGSTMAQSLAGDILNKMGRGERLPAAWGGLNIIVSLFCLPSEVVALKLQRPNSTHAYAHTQILTGCLFIGGLFLILINREWLVRQTFETRRAQAQETLNAKNNVHLRRQETPEPNHEAEYDDEQLLHERVERYSRLLGRLPIYFIIRMFYPLRV